jgi:ABC-type branched-subunit amino acid transport system substrate-binding protein
MDIMKRLHFVILFFVVALLWSCGTKSGVSPTAYSGPAGKLFLEAEEQFKAKSYEKALELYQDYLISYPDKPRAPASLMKIGAIHTSMGDYAQARQAYQYLINEYPQSSLMKDATFEILFTYYKESKFEEVILRAPAVMDEMESREHFFKVYALLGDTYKAKGAPIDAIEYYLQAQELSTMVEQAAINLKLKEAIAQLDSDDVAILLDSAEKRLPMDYLLFQLGLNYSMEEKYDDALTVLDEFINRYPDHENVPLARSLMDEIQKNAIFKRYTLGCLLPLSGPYQKFGYQALKGIELALDKFSSQSENPAVNIIIKDTAGNPEKTRQALHELNDEQVAAIIGPLVTAQTAAQEAQDLGIPIITITQKDGITSIGDNVFRNFITPQMQVEAITQYAMAYLGLTRFAILYPDETYGDTFMNLFWDKLIEKGGMVVGVQAYNPEHTDFAHPIKKLVGRYYRIPEDLRPELEAYHEYLNFQANRQKEEDAPDRQNEEDDADDEEEEPEPIVDFEAIFIPDAPRKAGLIIPQLAFYDVNDVLLMGTNLWHSHSLIKMAEQYVQGVIMPDAFFVNSDTPQVAAFVERFEETYQEKPGFIEAVMYDSAVLLLKIVSKPDIRFRSELRSELFNLVEFQGVTGTTRFDENGDAQKKLHLLTIKGRRFVELE